MVRKYPLYSVDRLTEELPGVSRRSIQRILERSNLSTAEKRLAFSTEKGFRLEKVKGMTREIRGLVEKLRGIMRLPRKRPQLNWLWVRNGVILGVLVLIFWQGINFVFAKPPQVNLEQPEPGLINRGESLFVSGKVVPAGSRVTVNGNEVSLNGDGTFTAVVSISLGETTLEVGAARWGRKSRVVRLVNRVATEEELQAKEEKEAKKKREASDKVAELERTVNDLLAAKNATIGKENFLRILNNRVKEEAGFFSVIGDVVNLGEEEASWVMITAKFYNQGGGVIDTKYGFATDFGQVLKPGGNFPFETQATTQEFDHYSLEISWEEGAVAGAATESGEIKEATLSGKSEEEADWEEE